MKNIESEGLLEKPVHLENLTEAEAANVLWLSFQFSQGNEEVQELILKKIRSYSTSPAIIDIPETIVLFSKKIATVPDEQGNSKFRLSNNNAHAEPSKGGMKEQLAKIQNYLKYLTGQNEGVIENTKKIIADIWDSDFLHIISRDGRPNRLDSNTGDNTLKDKFFSFGIHYLLRDNITANPVFNALLKEMRAVPFTEYKQTSLEYIVDIIEKYNEYHPETQVEQSVIDTITSAVNTTAAKPDPAL